MTRTPRRVVFVTVGTTKFDGLVEALDAASVADVLVARGYTHLVLQVGASRRQSSRLLPEGVKYGVLPNGLEVEWFDYSPSLAARIKEAALVISHAGAGSIFETLRQGVPLLVVPNPDLMDDHQAELAKKLEGMGVLVAATLPTLEATLELARFDDLEPYSPGDPAPIVNAIDRLVGVGKQE